MTGTRELHFIAVSFFPSVEGNCAFYYLTQPVRTFTCNPYHELSDGIRLQCSGHAPVNTTISILWYRSPGREGEPVEELGDRTRRVRITRRRAPQILSSRLAVFSLDGATQYWCQVAVEDGNETVLLEESSRVCLLPEEAYRNLPPCPPTAFLADAQSRCATDRPPDVTPTQCTPPSAPPTMTRPPNPPPSLTAHSPLPSTAVTTTTPNDSSSGSVNISSGGSPRRGDTIPEWGYALVALGIGGVVITGVVSMVTAGILCYRRQRRGSVKAATTGMCTTVYTMYNSCSYFFMSVCVMVKIPISHTHLGQPQDRIHAVQPSISIITTSPSGRTWHAPPSHLSVSRQPSNDSQYTTIDVVTPRQGAIPTISRGNGTQANGTRAEGRVPEGRLPGARATTEGAMAASRPVEADTDSDQQQSHRMPASPTNGHRTPVAARVLEDDRVYHIVDPSKCDPTPTVSPYTTPVSPQPSPKRSKPHVPAKPQRLQLPLLTDSGPYYCNDGTPPSPRQYQALSPQTRDYISVYSTTEKQQDTHSPT